MKCIICGRELKNIGIHGPIGPTCYKKAYNNQNAAVVSRKNNKKSRMIIGKPIFEVNDEQRQNEGTVANIEAKTNSKTIIAS